jgi:hypothetical protein
MDLDQNRPLKGPIPDHRDDIAGMNPQLAQSPANAPSAMNLHYFNLLILFHLIQGGHFLPLPASGGWIGGIEFLYFFPYFSINPWSLDFPHLKKSELSVSCLYHGLAIWIRR